MLCLPADGPSSSRRPPQTRGVFFGCRGCASTVGRGRLRRPRALCAARDAVAEGKNELERLLPREVEEAHRRAHDAGRDKYVDPTAGRPLLTRSFHMRRGVCCGKRCRHCPYGHVNVPAAAGLAPAGRRIA
ncbi:cob(I)alamin adenosyltransferase [Trypanosoma conorhini]|uniref:Cob(I)alamin adenosyltransferase n=1 Tax=Trypanosoma conorhini TaxID=83891 RepID=A0A3R7S5V0_9TRYP|nr:cob(I)alamin adenosyltransferase [Trypanosoma conorhini]RNF22018.1 cob(I)alamin adenosyltransferase [Trypanosoma conorhini]